MKDLHSANDLLQVTDTDIKTIEDVLNTEDMLLT